MTRQKRNEIDQPYTCRREFSASCAEIAGGEQGDRDARNPGSAFSLAIGGSETVNYRLLPKVYKDLLEHEPPVYLRLLTDPTDQMYQAVESRAIDLAIVLHEETTRYVQIDPFLRKALLLPEYLMKMKVYQM